MKIKQALYHFKNGKWTSSTLLSRGRALPYTASPPEEHYIQCEPCGFRQVQKEMIYACPS